MIFRAVKFRILVNAAVMALMLCFAVGSFAATISSPRRDRGPQKVSEKKTHYRSHRVRRGESLSTIAHRYHISVRALKRANNLRGNRLRAGARLKIPVSSARRSRHTKKSASSRRRSRYHRVRSGESLSTIAHRYHTSVRALKRANNLRGNRLRAGARLVIPGATSHRRRRRYSRYTTSTYVRNPGVGDVIAGEDPVVRAAAVKALGRHNGTIVAIDPSNGRILAMVNQKLALSSGAVPCSTIKVAVALAALSEDIVDNDTRVKLGRRRLDMNKALAYSNNRYFETLGRKLGFQRVQYYARLFGLGELAGWHIEGEHLGTYPKRVLPAKRGGVGKMCSFGTSIEMTPLQLGGILMAISNGGTLYYLQHPRTAEEVDDFRPKVKRYLDIAPMIPEVSEGMLGATRYGTARRLRASFTSEDVLGKTGTCSEGGTRFGWFGSFADSQYGRIVTVVLLQGDRSVFGPKAAGLAGRFYSELDKHDYFVQKSAPLPTESTLR